MIYIQVSGKYTCFLKILFILGGGREEGREGENASWLPAFRLGTWPITQECVLTGNQTVALSVYKPVLKSTEPHQQGQNIYTFLLVSKEILEANAMF